MANRYFYRMNFSEYTPEPLSPLPEALSVRSPTKSDMKTLTRLMEEAYSGTIDFNEEILEDADTEIKDYFQGGSGNTLLGPSRIALDSQGQAVSAVLVSRWGLHTAPIPLIAYVMTSPSWRRHQLAYQLMLQSMTDMQAANETAVRAVVTEGNTPSERLFTKLGFHKVVPGKRDSGN